MNECISHEWTTAKCIWCSWCNYGSLMIHLIKVWYWWFWYLVQVWLCRRKLERRLFTGDLLCPDLSKLRGSVRGFASSNFGVAAVQEANGPCEHQWHAWLICIELPWISACEHVWWRCLKLPLNTNAILFIAYSLALDIGWWHKKGVILYATGQIL